MRDYWNIKNKHLSPKLILQELEILDNGKKKIVIVGRPKKEIKTDFRRKDV